MNLTEISNRIFADAGILDWIKNALLIANAVLILGLVVEYAPAVRKLFKGFELDLLFEFIGGILVVVAIACELGLQFRAANIESDLRIANTQYAGLQKSQADEKIGTLALAERQQEAEAQSFRKKAAELELEILRIKSPRMLSLAQQQRILVAVRRFPGQQYALSAAPGQEPMDLACSIDGVLSKGGWKKHAPFGTLIVNALCGPVAPNSLSDVHVRIAPGAIQEVARAEFALSSVLSLAGLTTHSAMDPANISDKAVINVMVGIK